MQRGAQGRQVALALHDQRNKKLKPEKLELKKFNPFLRRHTLHKEIK